MAYSVCKCNIYFVPFFSSFGWTINLLITIWGNPFNGLKFLCMVWYHWRPPLSRDGWQQVNLFGTPFFLLCVFCKGFKERKSWIVFKDSNKEFKQWQPLKKASKVACTCENGSASTTQSVQIFFLRTLIKRYYC